MNSYRKTIFIVLSCFLIVMFYFCDSQAGLFKNNIPTGKEIKDPYLEQLFAPEFPYESIKGIETKEGKRYVIIKAKKKITQEQKDQYVFQTLLNRGVSVHRNISVHTGRIIDFMITIIRRTSTSGVIEYSENLIPQPKDPYQTKEGLREALKFKDENIIVEITPEFGHKFKRKVIYPEREIEGPEPQDIPETPDNITRYPDSKRIRIIKDNLKWPTIIYVTKDPIEKVIEFFIQKKKEYYDNNPHIRTDSLYTKGEEEHYLKMPQVQSSYILFGIRDIGGGAKFLGFSDLKRGKGVHIDLYQSGNVNLKEYVEIHIRR